MDITVILCTYNRCGLLEQALTSVAAQELPDSVTWEVLVVDNGSSDRTPELIGQFCNKFPGRFRHLFEPKPGKSFALNLAIAEAQGRVLAFMDDDVILDPAWLANLTLPLRDGKCVGAGGRIFPKWDCPPPKWIPKVGRQVDGPLIAFDLGPKSTPLLEAPYGTNMAFLREMFEKYGNFRTDLGPPPHSELRGEDTEFSLRLLAAAEKLSYEPAAVVYHPVPPQRMQKEYFLKWWFDKARGDLRISQVSSKGAWRVCGIPLVFFRRLIVWSVLWLFSFEPSVRFSRKINVWIVAGQILESYQQFSGASKAIGATTS